MIAPITSVAARPAPAWAIWANPIFRRYCRAQLRFKGLGISLVITLVVAGFLFFMFRTIAMYRGQLLQMDAERAPIIPLLVLQAVILYLLGTGHVAGGMTGEADEGVLDYQRLTPMTPIAKVLGYLFGLPVREYVSFLSTLPFTMWALWRGQVPPGTWIPLYSVFLTSALLYHLTGLVCGTVVKNRRWAFLVSILIVFGLYTVIPAISRFGFVFFKYLTLRPVFDESLDALVPSSAGVAMRYVQSLAPEARFFGLKVSEAVFTLFCQGVLILTFIVMLCRRWRCADSHLLGKIWATGLFAWIQVLLLGTALPLVESGLLFPSRELVRRFRVITRKPWEPSLDEAVAMVGGYGLCTLVILLVLILIITPTLDGQARGLRRTRKLGWSRIPPFSDASTAFWFVVVMAVTGAVGWYFFAHGLIESRWFPGHVVPIHAALTFALVFLGASLGFHAMLEAAGQRGPFLAIVFIGVVPVMIGVILGSAYDEWLTASTWLAGISPVAAPFYASQILVPDGNLSAKVAHAIPRAFWFWQGITALVAVWLVSRLWQTRKARAAAVNSENP